MTAHTLAGSEFPRPPDSRAGWPWTVAPAVPSVSSSDLPLISIVTPSFNQGGYLEETIRSVLLQGYPNLQYIVIDGGSTDQSVSILKRYAPWLSYWVSKPDRGQPSAINEGLRMARGSLFGFLNSDDLLFPGALQAVGEAHQRTPDNLIAGDVIEFRNTQDQIVQRVDQSGLIFEDLIRFWKEPHWHQPGIFLPRKLFDVIGPCDEALQFGFDYELMCRALQHAGVTLIDTPVALFRFHQDSKSTSSFGFQVREQYQVSRRYWTRLGEADRKAGRRYAARLVFGSGCSHLVRGRRTGPRLLLEGFAIDPVHAVTSSLRELPGWIARRLFRRSRGRSVNQLG